MEFAGGSHVGLGLLAGRVGPGPGPGPGPGGGDAGIRFLHGEAVASGEWRWFLRAAPAASCLTRGRVCREPHRCEGPGARRSPPLTTTTTMARDSFASKRTSRPHLFIPTMSLLNPFLYREKLEYSHQTRSIPLLSGVKFWFLKYLYPRACHDA